MTQQGSKYHEIVSPLTTRFVPSPNFGVRADECEIDLLLLHYTATPTGEDALHWLTTPESQVSSHYLIYEDGTIIQMVGEEHRAWHAGVSIWQGMRDINSCSIGIEIQNLGQGGDGQELPPYPEAQMRAVEELCLDIMARHSISPARVLGHSDVAPGRKLDPGPHFDWARLAQKGIGIWPHIDPLATDPLTPDPLADSDSLTPSSIEEEEARAKEESGGGSEAEILAAQKKLAQLGYGLDCDGVFNDHMKNVVCAFQSHWRQARVDGVLDRSTQVILSQVCAAASNK